MKQKLILFLSISSLILFCFIFSACQTLPAQIEEMPSITIYDKGIKTERQLIKFFLSNNKTVNKQKVKRLAKYYINECKIENINSDIAFVQMCLETGFLRFGLLVTEDMNNFCGLGAIDKDNRGCFFETEQLGVIAHVQHLKAYGTSEPLVNTLVDPRYKYVNPKGKAPSLYELAGTWAMDKEYGNKLFSLLTKLSKY